MRTKSAQPIKTDYADKIRKENPMNAVHQSLFSISRAKHGGTGYKNICACVFKQTALAEETPPSTSMGI